MSETGLSFTETARRAVHLYELAEALTPLWALMGLTIMHVRDLGG